MVIWCLPFTSSPCLPIQGRTNKKEWDTFSREVLNKKKFPVRLSEHLARDKVDLFNLWLAHGKDLHELLDRTSIFLFCSTEFIMPN